MQSVRTFLIGLAGFVAIVVAAFLFNVPFVALLVSLLLLLAVMPVVRLLSPKGKDSFLQETITSVDVIPEALENVEHSMHDVLDMTEQKIQKAWHHHHAELESIESELRTLSR